MSVVGSSSSAAPVRNYGGRAAGTRIAERRTQLVEAGVQLLGTAGAAAVTMRAVVREAALSPRYYYESFENHDAFMLAVYDEAADQVRRAALQAVSIPGGVEPRMRAAFTAVAGVFEADPRLGRIMFRETLADPVLRKHGGDVVYEFVGAVTAQLLGGANARLSGDPEEAELALKATGGALVALFLDWLDGRLMASRERLIDYCVRLTLRNLEIQEDTT